MSNWSKRTIRFLPSPAWNKTNRCAAKGSSKWRTGGESSPPKPAVERIWSLYSPQWWSLGCPLHFPRESKPQRNQRGPATTLLMKSARWKSQEKVPTSEGQAGLMIFMTFANDDELGACQWDALAIPMLGVVEGRLPVSWWPRELYIVSRRENKNQYVQMLCPLVAPGYAKRIKRTTCDCGSSVTVVATSALFRGPGRYKINIWTLIWWGNLYFIWDGIDLNVQWKWNLWRMNFRTPKLYLYNYTLHFTFIFKIKYTSVYSQMRISKGIYFWKTVSIFKKEKTTLKFNNYTFNWQIRISFCNWWILRALSMIHRSQTTEGMKENEPGGDADGGGGGIAWGERCFGKQPSSDLVPFAVCFWRGLLCSSSSIPGSCSSPPSIAITVAVRVQSQRNICLETQRLNGEFELRIWAVRVLILNKCVLTVVVVVVD